MPAEIRRIAASIAFSDALRSATGRYVRSRSAEIRGMSRMQRLIAVPLLSAKQFSTATNGRTLISSSAWPRYRSVTAIEVLRHGDVEPGIELFAAALQHALTSP